MAAVISAATVRVARDANEKELNNLPCDAELAKQVAEKIFGEITNKFEEFKDPSTIIPGKTKPRTYSFNLGWKESNPVFEAVKKKLPEYKEEGDHDKIRGIVQKFLEFVSKEEGLGVNLREFFKDSDWKYKFTVAADNLNFQLWDEPPAKPWMKLSSIPFVSYLFSKKEESTTPSIGDVYCELSRGTQYSSPF